MTTEPTYLYQGAEFSEDMKYRYTLWRCWDADKPTAVFILLNPSTADDKVLDPTVRRCLGYAMDWGFGTMEILNLFAIRSTDPSILYSEQNPVGNDNDFYIDYTCRHSVSPDKGKIIAAWGVHGIFKGRDKCVKDIINKIGLPMYCISLTQDGIPAHPLYLKGSLTPVLYGV